MNDNLNKFIKQNYCSSCKKRIIGYYFCPECGQEGSTIEKTQEKLNKIPIAVWIDHKVRNK